jgi:hypothetical protein
LIGKVNFKMNNKNCVAENASWASKAMLPVAANLLLLLNPHQTRFLPRVSLM